jgi:hypothetical protein
MASCPKGTCLSRFRQLDHARIWVQTLGRPFLLSHPYSSEITDQTRAYAQAHGLDLMPGRDDDGWYGHRTLPIVMTLPDNWPVWPIETVTHVLLWTQPIAWPDDQASQP